MGPGEVLAYLAGLMDGDGYLKVTKSFRTQDTGHPYYGITIGVQQLWPGAAVELFAETFGGKVKTWTLPSQRIIARCELHVRKAEAAIRRLLPYFLVKKDQAILLLEVSRLRQRTHRNSQERFDDLETIRESVRSLQRGSQKNAFDLLPASAYMRGYGQLGPVELGWTPNQVLAYLAGVMDSDGNFRVEKRKVQDMLGPNYRICVRCAQVNPSPAIDLLAKTFGGRATERRSRRPNRRDLVSWSLHDRSAVPAVGALLPYLVVKQAEAFLLLEMRRLKAQGKKGLTEWEHATRWRKLVRMRKRCYTADQVAEFERLFRTIQRMHTPESSVRG